MRAPRRESGNAGAGEPHHRQPRRRTITVRITSPLKKIKRVLGSLPAVRVEECGSRSCAGRFEEGRLAPNSTDGSSLFQHQDLCSTFQQPRKTRWEADLLRKLFTRMLRIRLIEEGSRELVLRTEKGACDCDRFTCALAGKRLRWGLRHICSKRSGDERTIARMDTISPGG